MIKYLPQNVISQIAAGEVIERPLNIVKELLDNALDAQATQLILEIEQGGHKKIRLIDNGVGMSKEDLELCLLPHTTSKLSSFEDLYDLHTLGFRGEALASMSLVSRLEIKSKVKDSAHGNLLLAERGHVIKIEACASNQGTTIEVSHLFVTQPARKKFLKSDSTEYAAILELVLSYAVAFPEVSFKFVHNKNMVFNVLAQTLEERLRTLSKPAFGQNLILVSFQDSYLTINGFIGKPQAAGYVKDSQYLFVNKRLISSSLLSKKVKEAYGTWLDAKSYPPYVLFLSLRGSLVDINVHPKKEEVRFWDEKYVADALYSALNTTLKQEDLTFSYSTQYALPDETALDHEYVLLKDKVNYWHPSQEVGNEIIQLDKNYLISAEPDGLWLIDQHAAHESILYEEYLKAYQIALQDQNFYLLPAPFLWSVSLSQKQKVEKYISELGTQGFVLEFFGDSVYKVSQIPLLFKDHDLQKLLPELLEHLDSSSSASLVDVASHRTLAFLACRTAVKAGEALSQEARISLVQKLKNTQGIFTCPHGRPVKVLMTLRDLHKLFKRIK